MKLRKIRKELGLSQKELSLKLNVSPTNIYNYEIGRTEPSIEVLIKLADILNVSIDYLVGREDDYGIIQSGISSTLTKTQTELLRVFNLLSMEDQHQVIGFAKALAN